MKFILNYKDQSTTDYLLMFLLLAVSGMPFFNGDIFIVGVFGLCLFYFVIRKNGFHRFYFLILFFFIILVLLHSLRFNNFPQNTYLGLIFKISIGYLVINLIGEKFLKYYVNVIVVLSVLSFFIFVPLFISPTFGSIFSAIGVSSSFIASGGESSLIFYHLNLDRVDGIYRNCGPFWEPAAYGGYLLIALMFNVARTNSLKERKSLIIIIALLTTISTTVFVLLAAFIFFIFFVNQKLIVKIFTVPVVVTIFIVGFLQLPILQEKLVREWERGDLSQEMKHTPEMSHTRLSSAIADYDDIVEYPLIGRGLFDLAFYDYRDINPRHNGVTKHIAKFGIIGAMVYFFCIYLSFKKIILYSDLNRLLIPVFFGLILGMGIAEVYFEKPFFWGLVFLHLVITPFSIRELQNRDLSNQKAFV